ncbi:MAG: phenylalanine--tRNA ligase subunit alpha [Candidatus Omnitrophota bacterium]
MEEEIRQAQNKIKEEISQLNDLAQLEELRIKYLGRKGFISDILGKMKGLSDNERPKIGALANELKNEITNLLKERQAELTKTKRKSQKIDVTMPGIPQGLGHLHPITRTMDEINEVFLNMGFRIAEGPEMDTEHYNFEALNIPLEHPSRDVFDTFYLERDILLRSHTSPVQIHVMEKEKPPLRVIAPGKVYRPDATDASHSFMFHQVEGFAVDKDISFADLKGTLAEFARKIFTPRTKMRFRPHFFPFTEPSAEVDISCLICGGKGCRVCSQKGWVEVLGAGMVDPNVFKAVNYDPQKWSGFAFGMGVERIAMLKYGIDDIRLFFENDVRFLRQF